MFGSSLVHGVPAPTKAINTLNTRLSRSRKIFATSNTSLSIPNTIFNIHFNMVSNTFPIQLITAIGFTPFQILLEQTLVTFPAMLHPLPL